MVLEMKVVSIILIILCAILISCHAAYESPEPPLAWRGKLVSKSDQKLDPFAADIFDSWIVRRSENDAFLCLGGAVARGKMTLSNGAATFEMDSLNAKSYDATATKIPRQFSFVKSSNNVLTYDVETKPSGEWRLKSIPAGKMPKFVSAPLNEGQEFLGTYIGGLVFRRTGQRAYDNARNGVGAIHFTLFKDGCVFGLANRTMVMLGTWQLKAKLVTIKLNYFLTETGPITLSQFQVRLPKLPNPIELSIADSVGFSMEHEYMLRGVPKRIKGGEEWLELKR
jgi:hypothetical protein